MSKVSKSKYRKRLPKVSNPLKRRKGAEERLREAFANVPRITNETVAEHREDVLAGARKYIYPLKHSRRRAVVISASITTAAIVLFLAFVGLSLYKFQSTSGFLYGVTKVLPLPVAKAGPSWVSYNSYLFELRHYMHYYETQQGVDFKSQSGKEQLERYKKQAKEQVVTDAYAKQLAKQYKIKVSNRQVSNQVDVMRSQNRLGASTREFREVLQEFWGWSESDFRRALSQQLLNQAVVARLDEQTRNRADDVLNQLKNGADFAQLAAAHSDDVATKAAGGQYNAPADRNNATVSPAVLAALAKLQPGEYSGIINSGFSLEIVKLNSVQDDKMQASHIQFNFKPLSEYIQPLQAKEPTTYFLR